MEKPDLTPPQWIRDAWSRDPQKDDVLFLTPEKWKGTPKAEQGPWRANACLHPNGEGDNGAYALGYRRGAQVLAEYAVREGMDQDLLIYPILFLYRHAVELWLKRCIPVAADLVDKPLEEHERKELACHRLDKLWSMFKPRLDLIRKNQRCKITQEVIDGIKSYIDQLRGVDENSYSFRYAADKNGNPNLGDLRYINIMRITVLMESLAQYCEGLDESIREQYQAKRECLWEARQQTLSEGGYDDE